MLSALAVLLIPASHAYGQARRINPQAPRQPSPSRGVPGRNPGPSQGVKAPPVETTAKPVLATSEGDGPQIALTCIGLEVPATVHVAAIVTAGSAGEAAGNPTSGPAPAVSASAGADSPLNYRYEWDFGDPQGRWNVLPGWNAAHVYDRPGEYAISLIVTGPSGKSTRRTTRVRVAPDQRPWIYVSADGNDAATGASPEQAVHSAARAFQLVQGGARVLFRRGDTFHVANTIGLHVHDVYVGTYDPGMTSAGPPVQATGSAREALPPPVLRKVQGPAKETSVFFIANNARNLVFDGLEFDSQWPLTSEYGLKKIPARAFTVGGSNITVRNCSFRNLTDAVNTELKPVGVLVQDNRFSDEIRGYCYYGNGSDHVIVGNVMRHSRQEHEIRCSEPGITRLLVAYNDLHRPNNNKGGIELRDANWFYVADNHIDGGTMRVGPQDDANVQAQVKNWQTIKCTWGVVQDNRLDRIWFHVRLGSEHIMVRNNVVRLDDGLWSYIVACDKPGFNEVRKAVDITLEHNTAINNGTKGRFIFVQGHPAGLTIRNNLYIAPHVQAGGDSSAIHATDPELNGFDAIEGNIYPAGAGGTHNLGKHDVSRQQWATHPKVRNERYEDVAVDEDDNPPPGLGAGAKMGRDKRQRDTERAAEGKSTADYHAPSPPPPAPPSAQPAAQPAGRVGVR